MLQKQLSPKASMVLTDPHPRQVCWYMSLARAVMLLSFFKDAVVHKSAGQPPQSVENAGPAGPTVRRPWGLTLFRLRPDHTRAKTPPPPSEFCANMP